MHAYLIISKDENSIETQIRKMSDFSDYKLLEFSVQKIEDARNLNSYINLSISEKTAILIKNFQNATEECVNAILKNIEEPQENLIYIIHSKSENSLLPTLRSRCRIIYIKSQINMSDNSEMDNFIKTNLSGKSDILSKYKKREEAVAFSERLLEFLTAKITANPNDKDIVRITKAAIILNKHLKRNGNINLQHLRFLTDISN